MYLIMRNKETGKYQYQESEKSFFIDVKDFAHESIEFHVVATKEQMEELEVISDIIFQLEQKKLALNIAEDKITALAKKMQSELKEQLNEKASAILAQITDYKYTHINIEETRSVLLTKLWLFYVDNL